MRTLENPTFCESEVGEVGQRDPSDRTGCLALTVADSARTESLIILTYPRRMVHHESHAQSHNESSGQMSPQPSMKRKKFDDDDLNGSKKARNRVRFVCYSLSRTWIYLKSLIFWGPAILVESATVVSRRYVRMFHVLGSSYRNYVA